MLDGSFLHVYQNADHDEQLRIDIWPDLPSVVDNRICCTAYNEDHEQYNDYELTFACEEILVENRNPEYDPETGTCDVEVESYVYVDLDANKMYDPIIDGPQYAYNVETHTDSYGDECCIKAA